MFERPVAGQISGQANLVHLEIMKRQNRRQQLDQEQGTVVVQPKQRAAAVRQFPGQAGAVRGQLLKNQEHSDGQCDQEAVEPVVRSVHEACCARLLPLSWRKLLG